MKKVIFTLIACFTLSVSIAQENEKTVIPYVSAGLSLGNGSFAQSSYASIEGGISMKNIGFGFCAGRSYLDFSTADIASNYFWEIKTSPTIPIKSFSIYGVLGYGGYFTTSNMFVEYGAGMSYMPKNFGYFAQWSNWDKLPYVSVGLSYCFN